jgi:hypothetical protein
MKHIYNIVSDMEIEFPNLEFQTGFKNGLYYVTIWSRIQSWKHMNVELIINEPQESVIASLLTNTGFQRREFTTILDYLLNSFD